MFGIESPDSLCRDPGRITRVLTFIVSSYRSLRPHRKPFIETKSTTPLPDWWSMPSASIWISTRRVGTFPVSITLFQLARSLPTGITESQSPIAHRIPWYSWTGIDHSGQRLTLVKNPHEMFTRPPMALSDYLEARRSATATAKAKRHCQHSLQHSHHQNRLPTEFRDKLGQTQRDVAAFMSEL